MGFGADSLFGEEFSGGAEEVVEEGGGIQAVVADPLADMGPVFLFDMGGKC